MSFKKKRYLISSDSLKKFYEGRNFKYLILEKNISNR